MINLLVNWCLHNRFLVMALTLLLCVWGVYAINRTPLDALPDLSENQVIVVTDWMGRSAQEIEDQVTYPLSTTLQGLPGVRTVRAMSTFGVGMITVVFEDDVDLYFARTRVLEKLNSLPFELPDGVIPSLGPDATGLGWVYQYYLDDSAAREQGKALSLGQLRTIQDWFIRYQLNSVPGVSEVASIGGFVEQYQVDVNPNMLRSHGVTLGEVIRAINESNRNVGGGNLEINGQEVTLRGLGYVETETDLRSLVVGFHMGKPVVVGDVATVRWGPAPRRGALDLNGREVTGGIVVMRYGESTLDVINRVKKKIDEIQPALPEGVVIRPFYDQSELIHRAVETLRGTLIEEIILVVLVNALFLMHFRSILITTIPLPLSILISFILMKEFGISSNIMSLSGIAIAIGVLVDAGIVVTEAVVREAHLVQEGKVPGLSYPRDILQIVKRACAVVSRPLFFSMAIITLAFVPVFALSGQAGKLFHPLAFTKTFAMMGATLLSVTVVPVLASIFIRGHLKDEEHNWLMRPLLALYLPILKFALRFRVVVLVTAFVIFLLAVVAGLGLGTEFMPKLNERALLFMPTTQASASLPEVNRAMAAQDKILASFPEVERVVGKLGRADTATDPAPVWMIETIITLKPKAEWRPGMTQDKLRQEMLDAMVEFPGFTPAMLQPIENRILMLSTGVRGEVAVKLFGSDLAQLESLAVKVEQVLKKVPGSKSVYAERIQGDPYLEFKIRHGDAARYGVSSGEILDVIETAIGGRNITTTIDGRNRYGIRVRYPRELRTSREEIGNVLVSTMSGEPIPLRQVCDIRVVTGPDSISSENGLLRVFVQSNVEGRDLAGFVEDAKKAIDAEVVLPSGVFISWGGQYENLIRAKERLMVVAVVVILVIFLLLYLTYHSLSEAAHVLMAVPFALSGGVFLQWIMDVPWSVSVWVGYIALFGTAVETGVIMVIYLEEALRRKHEEKGAGITMEDLKEAVIEGAVLRLRPKLMTVATILASLAFILIPALSGERTGIEVMRPLAVPVFGGMVSSLLHILIVTPVIFLLLREWEWRRENRKKQTPA